MNRVCIILVNWNGWRDTIECLESLFRLEYPDFCVVVCDNGSSDDSLQKIKTWADGDVHLQQSSASFHLLPTTPVKKTLSYVEYNRFQAESGGKEDAISSPLILIDIGENLGFAGGNNVALRYVLARGDFDYVWLLNNDTVVDPCALTFLLKRMLDSPRVGICGSTLLYYENPQRVQAYGGGYYCKWIGLPWHQGRLKNASDPCNTQRVERWMNYVVGASMLVSKDFLKSVGLLCEDYFLYFEELDWALRAKGRFDLGYAPRSVVYHKVGKSIGTSSNPAKKSYICDYYNVRNRLFFTWRFFSYAMPTVYFCLLATVLSRIYFGQWDRVKMILRLFIRFRYECRHIL